MKEFLCPYCYEYHTINDCRVKCSYDKLNNKCYYGFSKEVDDTIFNKNKQFCFNKCNFARKEICCPNYQQDLHIPISFLNKGSFPIALIGASASGKSNYIGVLVEQIRTKLAGAFGCNINLEADGGASFRTYKETYYRYLYENRSTVLATTPGEKPPLIFPIEIGKNIVPLSIYDTAGESFQSIMKMEKTTKYISSARGIILLIDPLQIEKIRECVKGKIDLPEINVDIIAVLDRIIEMYRNKLNRSGKVDIDLAVVFTKIDIFRDTPFEENVILTDSSHIDKGVFVQSDFDRMNLTMSRMLENFYQAEIFEKMKQFKNYGVFGVSSLGNSPNKTTLSTTQPQPIRVLDPLLWILAKNKLIKKIR